MSQRPLSINATGPQQVLAFNTRRTASTIHNVGTVTVYVSEDQTSITANGVPIDPGVSMTMLRAWQQRPHLQLFGQTIAGTALLRVDEQWGEPIKEA